jgi:hypothetical protein
LLKESAIWRDRNTDEVRAAKELRLFGLAEWVIDRFVARRTPIGPSHETNAHSPNSENAG